MATGSRVRGGIGGIGVRYRNFEENDPRVLRFKSVHIESLIKLLIGSALFIVY